MTGDPEMTSYLDDEIYERRRRRRIVTLVTAGALLVVATDVTAAAEWAIGTRSAGNAVTTLLVSVAIVAFAAWLLTHPPRPTCCWPPGDKDGAYTLGAAVMVRVGLPETTEPEDSQPPTPDEGEQR